MKTNPFTFHTGIEYNEQGSQHVGTCPFCEKQDKFYFNDETQWDCKNALCVTQDGKRRSGNLYHFLRQLHESFDTVTKASDIICELRDIPFPHIARFKPKFNPLNGTIILPTYKNGLINNLYKIDLESPKGKPMILATPTMDHTLFNAPDECTDDLWIAEGHWDRMALEAIISSHPEITGTAVPGCGVWKNAWTDYLDNKNVVFLYDNDAAGRSGYEKIIIKNIAQSNKKPRSIRYINWQDVKEGYDLNDLYKEHKKKSFVYINDHLKDFESTESIVVVKSTIENVMPDKSIDTFDKFLGRFEEVYHTTDDMRLGLLLVLCSLYSINKEGEQLWLRVIGPPGCGKTTIAKAVSASERVVLKSTFTGLFSGWADDKQEDASMIPLIAGKTLVVKDADALLRQPNVDRIFSELRDFYDKDSSTQFKNRIAHDYRNIRCTMILMGTNVLRRSDQSFLGERFLDYELRISKQDQESIERKMLARSIAVFGELGNLPPETPVQQAAKGFIDHHLLDRNVVPTFSDNLQQVIRRRAKLTSIMRTKVDRDMYGRGEITFQPIKEVATRLIGQYTKMAGCVPAVLNKEVWEPTAIKLLNKVTTDIIDPTSYRYQICNDLQEQWFTRDALVESTGLSQAIVTRELDNLRSLDLVKEKTGAGNRPGSKIKCFTLTDEIKLHLKELNDDV
jgi:hypothetical protein